MDEQKSFDFDGKARRDEGMERVLDNAGEDWRVGAERMVRAMRGKEMTGEDIRIMCSGSGIIPHHSNAWGGLVSGLVTRGVLKPTGRYTSMRDPKSHARETKVYLVF